MSTPNPFAKYTDPVASADQDNPFAKYVQPVASLVPPKRTLLDAALRRPPEKTSSVEAAGLFYYFLQIY